MIVYFNNKMLSDRFSINLAKWKRWSREFLPPDPLGGLQSGFARQYTPDEAFTVYLAGCLVSHLHFSIPDTRQILHDLLPWLSANGFRLDNQNAAAASQPTSTDAVMSHMIYIMANINGTDKIERECPFFYVIRSVFSTKVLAGGSDPFHEECFTETCLPPSISHPNTLFKMHPIKVLNISFLFDEFIKALDLEPK